ncbi:MULTISPECIES: hypothetical protein [Clostridioides]|uniref:hypothetical protein n=1 Tax=Clostridioides TaxID=1870884 RepID=UPI001D11BFFB|nr:hypothetical protein [Clostridioides sp. ES-S-0145-01]MCC0681853.1 hypothetical protein [Clostridioides sp. ES-S-0005-03]MCC0709249.1 hypothetical protein [Clostridioides sp. ES-S-0190-01]UDN64050.1 hypothetical protein IC758_20905 [Clostridioides sp. ES-W-0016-02]
MIENCKVRKQLEQCKFDELKAILRGLSKGTIIYPGIIKDKLNLAMEDVYTMLEQMVKDKAIKRGYELYCQSCINPKTKILNSIAGRFYCDVCGKELYPLKDSIVIYTVI